MVPTILFCLFSRFERFEFLGTNDFFLDVYFSRGTLPTKKERVKGTGGPRFAPEVPPEVSHPDRVPVDFHEQRLGMLFWVADLKGNSATHRYTHTHTHRPHPPLRNFMKNANQKQQHGNADHCRSGHKQVAERKKAPGPNSSTFLTAKQTNIRTCWALGSF